MVKDLTVTINVDASKLTNAFATLHQKHWNDPAPVYTNNARLIGAYHAHKGAGGEWCTRWWQSLGLRDAAFIRQYERRGEWGRIDLRPAIEERFGPGIALGQAATAFSNFSIAAAIAVKDIENTFAGFGASVNDGAAGALFTDADNIVIIERIKLRLWLESFCIPSEVACWIAGNLPAWALPAVLYSRLKRFSNE